ncbi:MAG: 2-amino-4-hydroxy-6-hydroxymethyldihydropteridine diphosphokinase [Porticoccaceae bacterium]|nr:2-amino-4-hydroxy-6-hydroxymethyldihydropteridine diphosphokinase [Porticoccaceae bacterium]
MARVYLSLGSNIDQQRYLRAALDALQEKFGELITSPVYESEAVGFDGDHFYNLVVGIDTTIPVGELSNDLRGIEERNDRTRSGSKFSSRTLDIDILTYGEECGVIDGIELPRDEILKYAFVLLPLTDIAGDARHPSLKKSYRELWDAFGGDKPATPQKLWRTGFSWQGKIISRPEAGCQI